MNFTGNDIQKTEAILDNFGSMCVHMSASESSLRELRAEWEKIRNKCHGIKEFTKRVKIVFLRGQYVWC